MSEQINIRTVKPEDMAAITRIYNEYVLHTVVSFEVEAVTEAEMLRRMQSVVPTCPYLVAEADGVVAGYCYVHPWKDRPAYAHTFETTVYLAPAYKGRGIGRLLMEELMAQCAASPRCHALVACITAENEASCAFHRKLGFRKVSHFEAVGYKFGRWLDVVDYEYVYPDNVLGGEEITSGYNP